ncbi:MAG: DUF2459 domain-containing protein [Bacteroidetes bacterium]|nr:DUF2459 domain-containing protein [Bacteroidota bacterium]
MKMLFLLINILLQSFVSVYLVKNNLHTGLIFNANSEINETIPATKNFIGYKYINIGWGDEDFYQHPDPDIIMGAKAVLIPTNSVVRIEGKNDDINKIAERSDYCIKFDLTETQFIKLCRFIDSSFTKDSNQNLTVVSQNDNNRIIFYKSVLKYHLFNTCNTWIAEAFESCGFDISSSEVITAENLFEELKNFGTIVKQESNNK